MSLSLSLNKQQKYQRTYLQSVQGTSKFSKITMACTHAKESSWDSHFKKASELTWFLLLRKPPLISTKNPLVSDTPSQRSIMWCAQTISMSLWKMSVVSLIQRRSFAFRSRWRPRRWHSSWLSSSRSCVTCGLEISSRCDGGMTCGCRRLSLQRWRRERAQWAAP